MADGSVVIGVKMNTSQADKDLAKLKKEIQSTEDTIGEQEAKKSPLTAQAEKLNQELKQARAEVQRLGQQWASGVAGADGQQAKAAARLNQIQAEYDGVVQKIDKIDAKLLPAYEKLDRMKEEAGGLQQNLNKAAKNTKKMEKAAKKADKHMGIFATRLRGIALSAFVFNIISSGFRGLTEWIGKSIKVNDEARAAIARLKGALLTLAQPILNIVIPAFTTFINILADLASRIAKFTATLFGSTLKGASEAAEALYDEQKALEGVGSAAKKAEGQLASFDEINTISSESATSGGGTSSGVIAPDFSGVGDMGWLEKTLGKAAGYVAAALMLGGVALVAIGASTGSLGMILAGLGLLLSGFAIGESTGVIQSWVDTLGLNNVAEFVTAALLLGGIALVAIGAATHNIGMVIAGLGFLGAGIAVGVESGTFSSWIETLGLDSVFDYVTAAMQLAGIALVAIGACMGNIAMVIAGGVILGLGVAADAIGEETLKDWWEVLKLTTVQQWVGVVTLLGGIALIAIGACMANILMIIAGIGLLAVATSNFASEEGSLKDWVAVLGLEKVAGWVTGALLLGGIALIVIGIVTANIPMVLAGLGLLGAGISVGITSGTFSSWLDTITSAFSSFKDGILNIWDSLWGGIKKFVNSIISGVEWMANKVIDGINTVIKAMNRVKFTMPDWLGGGTFGFNIQPLSKISLPRLATGAVIPPNREFLAVLGDQKSGTNIETPLATMVEAFKQAWSEVGGNSGTVTVVVNLDGREVARNTVRHVNDMTRERGKPVILV